MYVVFKTNHLGQFWDQLTLDLKRLAGNATLCLQIEAWYSIFISSYLWFRKNHTVC